MGRDTNVFDEAYWTQVIRDEPFVPENEVDVFFAKCGFDLNDPLTRWASWRIETQSARSVPRRCAFGNCTELWDPVDQVRTMAAGPPGCPCTNLPRSFHRHPDQRPKKRMDVKAVGRNGSRVLRSRRRQSTVGKSGLMRWAEAR